MDNLETRKQFDEIEVVDPKSIEELRDLRNEVVQANKKNGSFEGLKKILTDLYPDNAHFVYELIQNADDAGATSVTIQLEKGQLVFSHDGPKLFDLDDVKSITNIGQSTKKDDGTTIGKFGVGFKSVYTYTSSPIINSGEFHFQIFNLMVPEVLKETDGAYSTTRGTLITLPFNAGEKGKDAQTSYSEIKNILASFSAETLLFLRHITTITYEFEGSIYELSKTQKDSFAAVSVESPREKQIQYFLKFSENDAEIETEEGIKKLPIDVAYKLERRKKPPVVLNDSEVANNYVIVPADPTRSVFVSFLAEKETSGLRFYINGFFATTPSRDSIRNTPGNKALLQAIVELQLKSLEYIRDIGLLDVSFLGVLPNSRDNLKDFYKIFHEKLIEIFQEQSYMPAKRGGYFPAKKLISTSATISEIFTDADIRKIFSNNPIKKRQVEGWAKNPSQMNSNEAYFIEDLNLENWSIENLISFFNSAGFSLFGFDSLCIEILKEKSDRDLISLYCFLEDRCEDYSVEKLYGAPIFKLIDGSFVSAREKIYLCDGEASPSLRTNKFIPKELYTGRRAEKVISFFGKFGIEPYSVDALCEEILSKYSENPGEISETEHIKDILTLIRNNKFTSESIQSKKILLSKNGKYRNPGSIFLDATYSESRISSSLAKLSSYLEIEPLSEIYKLKLSPANFKKFIKTVEDKESGVVDGLRFDRISVFLNPLFRQKLLSYGRTSYYEKNEDYIIKGLIGILSRYDSTREASRLIWELILKDGENRLEARYSPNRSQQYRTCPAHYIQILTEREWILHKDGSLKSPAETVFEDLAMAWPKPDGENPYDNPVLKAIHFGEKSELTRREIERKQIACKEIGIDPRIVDILRQLNLPADDQVELLQRTVNESRRRANEIPMPVDNSANPNRREEKTQEEYKNSRNQARTVVNRTVRTTEDKAQAREYLKERYTDENGNLRCQICKNRMPFKTRKGEFYFEATQIKEKMKKEHPSQYLALCPNCSAEYSEWVRKDDVTQKKFISDIIEHENYSINESTEIPINLTNGKRIAVYFTGKHYLDIQVCLKEEDSKE